MNSSAENNLSKEIISAKSRVNRFLVVVEKNKDGCFAFTPELQGSRKYRSRDLVDLSSLEGRLRQ
jgi:hypothetical protein